MDEAFLYGARIIVAQTIPGKIADLRWLEHVAETFYGYYSDRDPRIIVVDELADFFEVRRGGGGIFWQSARSGRELNVALLAGSQRPRFIPSVVMTEADRLYLFKLDFADDMKHVYAMGVPKGVMVPKVPHSFYYWDKELEYDKPSGQTYVLEFV
jgi:hypothetical protein